MYTLPKWLGRLGTTLLCATFTLTAAPAAAVSYPDKPIRIVVQFAPGGSTDTMARVLGKELDKRLGQSVLVENRVGGGAIIGTNHVAKSRPDGYTLLLTIPGAIYNNLVLYQNLPYDPKTELRMVSDIATPRVLMLTHPSVPAKTFPELVELIKQHPGEYIMGSWGIGVQAHQVQTYMDQTLGTKTETASYKGEGPMLVDLASGVLPMGMSSVTGARSYLESGKLTPLAIAGDKRSEFAPEVPTFAEQGFKDPVYTITAPISLMAPAKTPDDIIELLSQAVAAIVAEPSFQKQLTTLGLEPIGNTAAEADANYEKNFPILTELTRSTGVSID